MLGSLDLTQMRIDSKLKIIEPDEPGPNWESVTRSGCGVGGSPRLVSRKLKDWPIPLQIPCLGSTPDAAMTVRDQLLAELNLAIAYEIDRTGSPCYLMRGVDDQDPLDVWTVFDYKGPRFLRKDLHGEAIVIVQFDLITFPGQRLPAGL